MVELLRRLESDMRTAESGKPVAVFDWVNDIHRDRVSCHALVRVLFLVLSIKRVTADDIALLTTELKSTTAQRRRPERQPRRPGKRLSPPLF